MSRIVERHLPDGKLRVHGLIVDTQPIADGIYEMICEAGQDNIVAFGMVPKQFIDIFEDQMRKRIIAQEAKKLGEPVATIEPLVNEQLVRDMLAPITHAITLGIFAAARKAGKLVV